MALLYTALNPSQKEIAAIYDKALLDRGITNPYYRAGILSVIAKESGFKLGSPEMCYNGTPNARIRAVFGSRVAALSEAQLTTLKSNCANFFNHVYGGEWGRKYLGNTQAGDGYKYRGRGANGITGRSNYTKYQKLTGYPILSNPDLVETPAVAAAVNAEYFKSAFNARKSSIMKIWGVDDYNKIKSLADGTNIAYGLNAGKLTNLQSDTTGGYARAMAAMNSYYNGLKDLARLYPTATKATGALLVAALFAGAAYLYLKKKKSIDPIGMGGTKYSKTELNKGIKNEMSEHGMSKKEATKTAKDHLKENPKYYTLMAKAGI